MTPRLRVRTPRLHDTGIGSSSSSATSICSPFSPRGPYVGVPIKLRTPRRSTPHDFRQDPKDLRCTWVHKEDNATASPRQSQAQRTGDQLWREMSPEQIWQAIGPEAEPSEDTDTPCTAQADPERPRGSAGMPQHVKLDSRPTSAGGIPHQNPSSKVVGKSSESQNSNVERLRMEAALFSQAPEPELTRSSYITSMDSFFTNSVTATLSCPSSRASPCMCGLLDDTEEAPIQLPQASVSQCVTRYRRSSTERRHGTGPSHKVFSGLRAMKVLQHRKPQIEAGE